MGRFTNFIKQNLGLGFGNKEFDVKCTCCGAMNKIDPSNQTDNWLSGICQFPKEVVQTPLGWKATNGASFEILDSLSQEEIQELVDNGTILFSNGDGDYFESSEYYKLYGIRPEINLAMRGRFWPNYKKRVVGYIGNTCSTT